MAIKPIFARWLNLSVVSFSDADFKDKTHCHGGSGSDGGRMDKLWEPLENLFSDRRLFVNVETVGNRVIQIKAVQPPPKED